MIALWHFYWPMLVAATLIGIATGFIAFRRRGVRQRNLAIAAGLAAVLACALLWHWPGGAAARLSDRLEQIARIELDRVEMPRVSAQLKEPPLTRTLVLSGPADRFQRRELPRHMSGVPGVEDVVWEDGRPGYGVPLLAEVPGSAAVAFGLGLLLAYLVVLRRRANAGRRW